MKNEIDIIDQIKQAADILLETEGAEASLQFVQDMDNAITEHIQWGVEIDKYKEVREKTSAEIRDGIDRWEKANLAYQLLGRGDRLDEHEWNFIEEFGDKNCEHRKQQYLVRFPDQQRTA